MNIFIVYTLLFRMFYSPRNIFYAIILRIRYRLRSKTSTTIIIVAFSPTISP